MIKGCQREMIVVQTQESPVFESAYFILRRKPAVQEHTDMVTEANRLIAQGSGEASRHKKRCLGRWWLFGLGFLSGSVLWLLLWALL